MSLPVEYFERIYAADLDPWGFRSRWYERRKYALTLAVLPRERYRHAFEPGCSVGVLTEQLAGRCERLLALEPVPRVAAAARESVAARPNVRVHVGSIPDDWPDARFDLIVLSEVGYYLAEEQLPSLADHIVRSLEPDGDVVAVHWRPDVADYPSTADQVHAALRSRPELAPLISHEEGDFLLEVFRHGPAQSVAQEEGLR